MLGNCQASRVVARLLLLLPPNKPCPQVAAPSQVLWVIIGGMAKTASRARRNRPYFTPGVHLNFFPEHPMPAHNPWTVLAKETVHETAWISVEHHDVITPSGTHGIYTCVDFKHWAIGIVPIDDSGNTYLVGQYRFPLGEYSWEIPEGGGDKRIPPLVSAQRELLEETGITAACWELIYEFNTSNSVTNERAFVFVATGLSFGEPEPDATEQLALRKIPFCELLAMVYRNEIKDSLTIIGALMAARHLAAGT